MGFITENFLLHSETARHLYRKYAAQQPILDYHSHLPPKDVAQNRQFRNLFEIWLEGDHYKWRAMRSNGTAERYCTGDAEPYEKFLAWARTVPYTLRNPLYQWTHLELKRYFGIDELMDENTAPAIWKRANARLATPELRAQGILEHFQVRALCTTDDPAEDLNWHRQIAGSSLSTRVYPTFRPDKALRVNLPEKFNEWVNLLAETSNRHIARFPDFLAALRARHDDFHQIGGRLSDHGLEQCHVDFCDEREAGLIFDKVRSGKAASPEEHSRFASFMMLYFGQLDAEKGWTKQLHLGAARNLNTRMFKKIGPDSGFDSIGDFPQVKTCALYLDRLEQEQALPKTVLYNVNPRDNYSFAAMVGAFQDGNLAGKIQFGTAWWFLDQKEGIELQLNALSNVGLLSRFVGMVTDSRSFMSYTRHEFFRRVLCNLIGQDVEKGELPDDESLLGRMVENICFHNAAEYMGLELPREDDTPADRAAAAVTVPAKS